MSIKWKNVDDLGFWINFDYFKYIEIKESPENNGYYYIAAIDCQGGVVMIKNSQDKKSLEKWLKENMYD